MFSLKPKNLRKNEFRHQKKIFGDFLEREKLLVAEKGTPAASAGCRRWDSAINSVNYKALAHRSRKVCLLKHPES